MFDRDIIKLAWMSLWRRKLRTILTMVGIMIGTAGIVIMISLGAGLERSVVGAFEGTNVTNLEVYPGMDQTKSEEVKILKKEDLLELEKLDGVKAVTPIFTYYGDLNIGREQIGSQLIGIDMHTAKDLGYILEEGRFPRNNEMLIGSALLENIQEILGDTNIIRKAATIVTMAINEENDEQEERDFRSRVVGSLQATGGTEDYSAIMDIETLVELKEQTEGKRNIISTEGYSSIKVIAENTDVVDQLSKEINEMGYMTFSVTDILDSIGSVFKFLQVFLGGIGSISLLVAAIGITNTMVMSIYERTKEIGVNKVIGASVKDIRNQFLYEASIIGFMGGVAGLILSYLITILINFIAGIFINSQAGPEVAQVVNIAYIPLWLAIFAITFSIVIGILAGLYPANRAAKISVLEALRQE